MAAVINSSFIQFLQISSELYSRTVAPMMEEILKFIPVLIISCIVKKGRRGSAANAYAVGVGFCVSENFSYLFSYLDTANVLWIIARCFCTGVMHSMSTTLSGMGIYNARISQKHKILCAFLGLLCAMALHMAYNNLVAMQKWRILGAMLPIVMFILLFFITKKESVRDFLWDGDTH